LIEGPWWSLSSAVYLFIEYIFLSPHWILCRVCYYSVYCWNYVYNFSSSVQRRAPKYYADPFSELTVTKEGGIHNSSGSYSTYASFLFMKWDLANNMIITKVSFNGILNKEHGLSVSDCDWTQTCRLAMRTGIK
jgi:hypothetical protein